MKNLSGLIICGGKSLRFGSDKSLIKYYDIPQREYLYKLLSKFCDNVYFSINASQAVNFNSTYKTIIDEKEYGDAGPMSALLSMWKKFPDVSLLVTGCDYPFVNENVLKILLTNRSYEATCFVHADGKLCEPFLSVYENSFYKTVLENYSNGNLSLSKILAVSNVKTVLPPSDLTLKNVNTPEEYSEVKKMLSFSNERQKSSQSFTVKKISLEEVKDTVDKLAVEEPLEIRISYSDKQGCRKIKPVSITMRTPAPEEDAELAAGFLFTEGIIKDKKEIDRISSPAEQVVVIELNESVNPDLQKLERNFYTTSSCGVCGKISIEAVRSICPSGNVEKNLIKVPAAIINSLPARLREKQDIFNKTGGLHACALFELNGNLLALKEDVGRHNALDKLIGASMLKDLLPLNEHIILLSGRSSFELIQKAAMASVNIVCSVGAPSSLAVKMAEESKITLIGFLRDERFNIYSGEERVKIKKFI